MQVAYRDDLIYFLILSRCTHGPLPSLGTNRLLSEDLWGREHPCEERPRIGRVTLMERTGVLDGADGDELGNRK